MAKEVETKKRNGMYNVHNFMTLVKYWLIAAVQATPVAEKTTKVKKAAVSEKKRKGTGPYFW